jgi:chitodextrinase
MAVTKTLTTALPYNLNNKVQKWDLGMTYNQGSKTADPPTYYESTFTTTIPAVDTNGTVNFTAKAKADWTKSELEALCPISQWDIVFASQVDSVITNPVVNPEPDRSYSIPE